jgi:single-strand DNA-binding protein
MNTVILQGNLGADPKMFKSNTGLSIASFTLATSKKRKDGTTLTSWHNCSAFGHTAESICTNLKKGSFVLLHGELNYTKYEKDGQSLTSTKIIVNSVAITLPNSHNQALINQPTDNSADTQTSQKSNYSAIKDGAYKPMASYDLEDDVPF